MYVFDTDILSNLMRPRPSAALLERLSTTPVSQQYTTSITLGELLYGVQKRATNAELLQRQIERVLLHGYTVLPFDAAAARVYAHVRAELERAGTPLAEADLRIGSIARSLSFTVITANVRHFSRIRGLIVENWLQ